MYRVLNFPRFVAIFVITLFVCLPVSAVPGAASPGLGTAESYSVLAGSIVTNTGPSTISGDLGVSPGIGAVPHISGFPPGIVGPTGTIHDADANAGLAQADSIAAFGALSAPPNAVCDTIFAPNQNLSGLTLAPGVYCFPTSAQLTTGVALTLDGGGDPAATWIFSMASTLNTTPGVNATVNVINGGLACNVWWKVGSSASLGSSTSFLGNILALTSISLGTGASLDGRALAQTGAVTLDTNVISGPTCSPTAVELLNFWAAPLRNQQVRLEWAAALEVNNFGFNLYRANVDDRAQAALIHFEPAVPQGGGSGATYMYVDTAPDYGSWWYWLADVDTQGHETLHTPINTLVQSLNKSLFIPLMVK